MRRLGKLLLVLGMVPAAVLALLVVTEINLAVTCWKATPDCLPRYRAAGHIWSKLGVPMRARAWYQRGADAGDPIAMFHLGWAYQQSGWADFVASTGFWMFSLPPVPKLGPGVPQAMLRHAAEDVIRFLTGREPRRSWPDAALNSLFPWRFGNAGTPQGRFAKAASWYERSASLGFAPAANNLAALYYEGLGVEEDRAKAEALALQAAEAGNPVAAMNVAMLASGAGRRDDKLRAKWSTFEPWRASPDNLTEPNFERTILFLGGSIPAKRRDLIRAAAEAKVSVEFTQKPLTPDPSLPVFQRVPSALVSGR